MFQRLFSQNLPEPNPVQNETELKPREIGLEAELTACAYEPRFRLIALGTSTGVLYVLNSKGTVLVSREKVSSAICCLFPLTNSSNFVSLSSPSTYRNHPNLRKNSSSLPDKMPTLATATPPSITSDISHWIILPDRITMRTVSLRKDIVSIAISPTHPQFGLVLLSDGSITGFSFEQLKFTELYINNFEGKPVISIFSPTQMSFYICHQETERLDIDTLELYSYSSVTGTSFDFCDSQAVLITSDGIPTFLKSGKIAAQVKPPENHKAVFTAMNGKDCWICVLRTNNGDKLYVNGEQKLELHDDYFVPNVMIDFKNPFNRMEVNGTYLTTTTGKFYCVQHLPNYRLHFPPFDLDATAAFITNDSDIVLFSNEQKHIISNSSYIGLVKNEYGIPLKYVNGKYLFIEDNQKVILVNGNEKQEIIDTPITQINLTKFKLDIVDDKEQMHEYDFETGELKQIELKLPPDVLMWRPYCESIIYINNKYELIYGSQKTQICNQKEKILMLETINELGQLTYGTGYVLIISNQKSYLFETEKMKKIRSESFSSEIMNVTITEWGTMLALGVDVVLILCLPDFTYQPLGILPLRSDSRVILIEHKGIVVLENHEIYTYLPDYQPIELYDPDTPAIIDPEPKTVLSWFKKKKPSLEQVDDSFGYKRAANSVDETMQIMQQMVAQAAQRSEALAEMEMKAQNLMNSAKKFRDMARSFRK